MQKVNIHKGHRFAIAGSPQRETGDLPEPARVALLPSKIGHIRPRLKVAEGDSVSLGTPLIEDKRNSAFRFLSPGGGTVSRIVFGARRSIEAIVIDIDSDNEPFVEFPRIPAGQLAQIDRRELVAQILNGGLWWIFRELPFSDLPAPETIPPRIIVELGAKEPFQPLASVYLQDRGDLLDYGLKVLGKLTDGPVMVLGDGADKELGRHFGGRLTHLVNGRYPADDAGVLNYHLKTSADQNRTWTVNGQDVLLLAQLLLEGRYPVERTVAIGGSDAPVRRHVRTRMGVPLADLVPKADVPTTTRWVVGGLMRGFAGDADGYMGLRETSLTLLPEGDRGRFLALFNPGLGAPSHSRIFLSAIHTKPLVYDCNLKGDERACIACMHCADVCPVDILPHMTYKAVLAEEVEEYLAHGLLDCVACGLCSYVCPSKIELTQTFQAAKAAYAKEQASVQQP